MFLSVRYGKRTFHTVINDIFDAAAKRLSSVKIKQCDRAHNRIRFHRHDTLQRNFLKGLHLRRIGKRKQKRAAKRAVKSAEGEGKSE